LRHPGSKGGQIERGAGLNPRDNHARHRQVVEHKAAAEPRLQQFGGFGLGERPDLDNAGLCAHRVRHRNRERLL